MFMLCRSLDGSEVRSPPPLPLNTGGGGGYIVHTDTAPALHMQYTHKCTHLSQTQPPLHFDFEDPNLPIGHSDK